MLICFFFALMIPSPPKNLYICCYDYKKSMMNFNARSFFRDVSSATLSVNLTLREITNVS